MYRARNCLSVCVTLWVIVSRHFVCVCVWVCVSVCLCVRGPHTRHPLPYSATELSLWPNPSFLELPLPHGSGVLQEVIRLPGLPGPGVQRPPPWGKLRSKKGVVCLSHKVRSEEAVRPLAPLRTWRLWEGTAWTSPAGRVQGTSPSLYSSFFFFIIIISLFLLARNLEVAKPS